MLYIMLKFINGNIIYMILTEFKYKDWFEINFRSCKEKSIVNMSILVFKN